MVMAKTIKVKGNVKKLASYVKAVAGEIAKLDGFVRDWSVYEMLTGEEWDALVADAKSRDPKRFVDGFESWKENRGDNLTEAFAKYGESWYLCVLIDAAVDELEQ